MDSCEAEEMANSMLLDSPLPDAERSDERLPEGDGSDNFPKGGGEKLPEEVPTGKLIVPFREEIPLFVWFGFVTQVFSLDSQNPGNIVEKVDVVPLLTVVMCEI